MSISGKLLRLQVGATTLDGAFAWTVEETAEPLDGTTGEDLGFDNPDVGVFGANISLELLMDVTTGQYSIIRRGTLITNLKCWLSSLAQNPMFAFPSARVMTSTPKGEVRGRFVVSVSARSVGSYTQNDPN